MINLENIVRDQIKINGEEQFFKSSVLVLLVNIDDQWNLIFQKRAKGIRQGGEISFPGGKFDKKDKTALETAIRETEEELLISRKNIDVLGELDTIIAPMGAIVKPFIATTSLLYEKINFNKTEVEYLFTVPLKWFIENPPEIYHIVLKAHSEILDKDGKKVILFPAKELGLPEKYHNIWGNIKQKVYLYRYKNEIIWGLTAKIIFNIIENIKNH